MPGRSKARKKNQSAQVKFPSMRSYRKFLDQVMAEAYAGLRPTSDIQKFSGAIKVASELYVTEQRLQAANADHELPHPHGEHGGQEMPLKRGTYRERTEVRKSGHSADSGRFEETQVSQDVSEPDPAHGEAMDAHGFDDGSSEGGEDAMLVEHTPSPTVEFEVSPVPRDRKLPI